MTEVRILVVDDEPVSRLITETVLTGQGFVVRSAESAEQAFALLAEGFAPSLILLDVVMPGMSGYEACRRLRADPGFEHLPIVMLTSVGKVTGMSFGSDAELVPVDAFFEKPVPPAELLRKVRELLEKSEAGHARR